MPPSRGNSNNSSGSGKATRPTSSSGSATLKFYDGATQFRLRLTLSLLTHRPVLIRNIRSSSVEAPGLAPHEISYLRLLDGITNGTTIEINATGTQCRFVPGILVGGDVHHDCYSPIGNGAGDSSASTTSNDNTSSTGIGQPRSIGWYLEFLLPLAPFAKSPLNLTLTGITDGLTHLDPSPDYLTVSALPLLRQFGIGTEADEDYPPTIRVTKRGASPMGGGTVQFYCPIVKRSSGAVGVGGEIRPIDLTTVGKIKRVRGTVVTCRIPPSSAARAAHAAKGVLHRLLPDVWIHTDAHTSRGKRGGAADEEGGKYRPGKSGCGQSPGMTMHLTALSTEGHVLAAETSLDSSSGGGRMLPEDLGQRQPRSSWRRYVGVGASTPACSPWLLF